MNHPERLFVCTECGSFEASGELRPPAAVGDGGLSSGVSRLMVCARCGFAIPAHLGERQDGMTIEQARREWLERFRPTALRRQGVRTAMGTDLRRRVVLRTTIEELQLRNDGLYRVSRAVDYRRCYRTVGGERLLDGAEPPLESYSAEYLGGLE